MRRVLLARVGLAVQRLDVHAPHQRTHVAPAHPHTFAVKDVAQHPRARKRVLQMQLVGAAHWRAASSHATILVMKTPSGDLVGRQTSGQVVVLKALPAATPVLTGTVLKRAAKRAIKADGR